jgi:hypothetical protein
MMPAKFSLPQSITILALLMLTACSGGTAVSTATAVLSETAVPSAIPIPTSTPTQVELTSTPDPLKGLDPEIRELFSAQNVGFEAGADGSLKVDLADTPSKESITIENITHTKTNDGLSQNILTATSKEDGSRMVHIEGFGWVKDMEFNFTDPNTLTVVPENWPNRAINTLAALHYSENPRIPENAVDPQFNINIGGFGGNMGSLSTP